MVLALSLLCGVAMAQVPIGPGISPLSFTPPAVINVVDSGAVCNDTSDDTGALNTVAAKARALIAAGVGFEIVFPQGGKCKVTGLGVNWTNLSIYPNAYPGIIDGNGATIDGQVADSAVVDFLGNTSLVVRDLKILGSGSAGVYPTTGIQYGRVSSLSADRNEFENVIVQGNFSVAACYNLASEDWTGVNVKCYNSDPSASSFAGVFDGINHFGLTSNFVTITLPTDAISSLQHAVCLGCDYRQNASGHTLWLANTSGFRMYGGYILNQASLAPLVLYTGIGTLRDTHIDAHMENTTIPNNVLISGSASPTIEGLELQETANFATTSILALDSGVTSATILNLNISEYLFNTPTATVFDTANNYTIIGGAVNLPSVANWGNPLSYTGSLAFSGVVSPGKGATWNYGGGANIATGVNATVVGGINNAATGANSVAGGSTVNMAGTGGTGFGVGARDYGRLGADCYASNGGPTFQSCSSQLRATISTGTQTQLTINGAAASTANEFNVITNNTTFGFGLRISCRNITTSGNDITVLWHNIMLSRDANAGTTVLTVDSTTVPDVSTSRGTAGFTWLLAADTTNAGLSVKVTPPNANTWDCGAMITPSMEVQ